MASLIFLSGSTLTKISHNIDLEENGNIKNVFFLLLRA